MSALTGGSRRGSFLTTESRVTFGGVLRSEWIKLWSLRSTVWSFALFIALTLGLCVTVGLVISQPDDPANQTFANLTATNAATLAVMANQLVVAVLGVLFISGEYATGQIRSTFTVVPGRTAVPLAKAVVFAVSTFVLSLGAMVGAYFVNTPLLARVGIHTSILAPEVGLPFIGAALFLTTIGLISLGIGAIFRSTAVGLCASLGLILVVPSMLTIIGAGWSLAIKPWLPSVAGMRLFLTTGQLDYISAILVMLGWVAVFLAVATLLLKRRDA